MYYQYPSLHIDRINKSQRAQRALIIQVNSPGSSGKSARYSPGKPVYFELLYPSISLKQLELEAAVNIGSDFFSVSAFLRCAEHHLYALKPVRLSRLNRPNEVVAEYDSMASLIRVNPEQYQQASQEATGQSITYLEYRRRRRVGAASSLIPYRDKVILTRVEDPRESADGSLMPYRDKLKATRVEDACECGVDFQAELERLDAPEPIQLPERHTYTQWYRISTQPKARASRKRKERLPLGDWFCDYFKAFRALGWNCRNEGIESSRVTLTPQEQRSMTALAFEKDRSAVILYSSVQHVPFYDFLDDTKRFFDGPVDNLVRIVHGRRPDAGRGICRLPDGTATRIIPDQDAGSAFWRMGEHASASCLTAGEQLQFFVEFDVGLFEPTAELTWRPCSADYAQRLYQDYLNASPHHKTFRAYRAQKRLTPHGCLPCDDLPQNVIQFEKGEARYERQLAIS